jgi:hypothetical protein
MKKEILEGNKLIAEFMGLEIITDGISFFDTSYKPLQKYDSSWDCIMLVIDKIDQIGANVLIGRMFCDIKYIDPFNSLKSFDIRIISGVKINAINGAIIEFIKWYNTETK